MKVLRHVGQISALPIRVRRNIHMRQWCESSHEMTYQNAHDCITGIIPNMHTHNALLTTQVVNFVMTQVFCFEKPGNLLKRRRKLILSSPKSI